MSVPPAVVQIKRKRDDDAPPETLHIQHYNDKHGKDEHYSTGNLPKRRNKSSVSELWVFQKVSQYPNKEEEFKESSNAQNPWENKVPVVKATQPGDELRRSPPTSKGIHGAKSTLNHNATSSIMLAASAASSSMLTTSDPPRRFHLTRATKTIPPRTLAKINGVRKARKTRAVATFIELHPDNLRSTKKFHKVKEAGKQIALQMTSEDSTATKHMDTEAIPERALKRPGRNASKLLKQAPSAALTKHEGSEELTSEMQQFARETMAQDAAEHNAKPVSLAPKTSTLTTRLEFKPRPPAQRYSERHAPDVLLSKPDQPSDADLEGEEHTDTDDENDYVLETYVRVPAHTIQIVPADVGVLVIGNDEEMDAFYEFGEDSDDDSDIFDDEIDENAENNPNNEYPDEEVDSDDEFDLNAYKYRHNASDDEEFDFDETNYSDDGNDLPWTEATWGKQKKPSWEVDENDMSDD